MSRELTTTVRLKGVLDPSLERTFNTVKKELTSLKAANGIDNFSDRMIEKGKQLQKLGSTLQGVGKNLTRKVTVPIVTGMAVSAKAAGEFQYRFAKVSSIVKANGDQSAGSMSKFRQEISRAAIETGMSMDTFTEQVYQAISAGRNASQSIKAVSAAHKLAVAGFTSDASALDMLTTITNAYGKSAGNLTHISDVLIQTQNRGKVQVGELAKTMGKVIPTAKSMGISFEDVGAQYAVLTQKGIKARYATTYMNSLFNELGKGSSKASKALKQATGGKSLQEFLKSGHDVGDALTVLQDYCDKTGQSFHDLWGNVNSSKAAESLAESTKKYKQYLSEMKTGKGTTEQAFAAISNTFPMRLKKIKNELRNALIGIGDIVIQTVGPMLAPITKAVQRVDIAINGMSGKTKRRIGKILIAFAALGPVISIIGKITSGIGGMMKIIGLASSAFSVFGAATTGFGALAAGIAPEIGVAVAAIAALAGAIALAVTGFSKLSKYLTKKKVAKNSVQKSFDDYQNVKAKYNKGKATKEQLTAAKNSYEAQQKAYTKAYGKPFKVKLTEKTEKKGSSKSKNTNKKSTYGDRVKQDQKNLQTAVNNYKKASDNIQKIRKTDAKNFAKVKASEVVTAGMTSKQRKAIEQKYTDWYMKHSQKAQKASQDYQKAKKSLSTAQSTLTKTSQSSKVPKSAASGYSDKSPLAGAQKRLSSFNQSAAQNTSKAWQSVKNVVVNGASSAASVASAKWGAMKTSIVSHTQSMAASVSAKWQAIKTSTSTTFANVKSSISSHLSGAVSIVSGKMASIKSSMSSHMASAYAVVSAKLSSIRAAFSSKMAGAASAVRGAMAKVKAAFSAKLSEIKAKVSAKLAQIRALFAHPITTTINIVQNMIGGGKGSGGKGGGKKAKKHAKGGFTNGLAIAGEDPRYPVEAVISFNPRYRKQNIKYWRRAGRMLGMTPKAEASENPPSYKEAVNRLGDYTTDDFSALGERYNKAVTANTQQYSKEVKSANLYEGTQSFQDSSALNNSQEAIYQASIENAKKFTSNGFLDADAYDASSGLYTNRLGDIENDSFSLAGMYDLNPTYSAVVGRMLSKSDVDPIFPLMEAESVSSKDDNSVSNQVQAPVNVGGITFSPVINVPKGSDVSAEKIVDMLRDYGPEFTDFIMEKINERMRESYVGS